MSKKYCPVCNRLLTFGLTMPIEFEKTNICSYCFNKAIKEKITQISELKKVVEIFPISEEQLETKEESASSKNSNQISIETKTSGFGFLKACLGFTALGPFGLLCGLCGSGKTTTTVSKQ